MQGCCDYFFKVATPLPTTVLCTFTLFLSAAAKLNNHKTFFLLRLTHTDRDAVISSRCPQLLLLSSAPHTVLDSSRCPQLLPLSSTPPAVLKSSCCPQILPLSSTPPAVLLLSAPPIAHSSCCPLTNLNQEISLFSNGKTTFIYPLYFSKNDPFN